MQEEVKSTFTSCCPGGGNPASPQRGVEMSPSIGELAKALCKAQAAMKPALAASENPYFKSKYADLAAVWENCRQPLTSNGLSVVQAIENEEGRVVVKTFLLHESGEWISSRLGLTPVKSDPQSIGSAITYARRYALAAMVGVCAEDEDDDGNASSGKAEGVPDNSIKSGNAQAPQETADPPATEAQLKKIYALSKELGLDREAMRAIMRERCNGKESSKELTKSEASDLIEYLAAER